MGPKRIQKICLQISTSNIVALRPKYIGPNMVFFILDLMRSDALELEFLVLVPLIRSMPKISPAFCFESYADFHFLCSNQSLD